MFSPTSMSAMSIETISNAVLRIELPVEHRLGDAVGVLQHVHVVVGRADGADDAFADAGDDRLLASPRRSAAAGWPAR